MTRRSRRAGRAISILAAGAAAALASGTAAGAVVITPAPECSVSGAPMGAPAAGWIGATACDWGVHHSPESGGAEFRTSLDGGTTWSEPRPAPSTYEPPAGFATIPTEWWAPLRRAGVVIGDEGVQAVQFRTVGADGSRGAWGGAAPMRVDRSPPSTPRLAGTGPRWRDRFEDPRVTVDSRDAGSGITSFQVRYGPRPAGPFPGLASCGEAVVWAACNLQEPAADGTRTLTLSGLLGELWLSARACDALGHCSDWGPPTRMRVSIRDGAAASSLIGGENADLIRAGGGADRLSGRDGDDRLQGQIGADRLLGGPGDDHLIGGPGADLLVGGPGRDLLVGGPGDDRVLAHDGDADRIRCGAGQDTVVADRLDRVAGDCERVVTR